MLEVLLHKGYRHPEREDARRKIVGSNSDALEKSAKVKAFQAVLEMEPHCQGKTNNFLGQG